MTEFDYIKERLDDQINWYGAKSGTNQKNYKRLELLRLALAVSIPVLTLLIEWEPMKYIIAAVGALIAFLEGINKVYNYKELWTKYRITAEALKREKLLYVTATSPYTGDESLQLLIERSERLMGAENNSWISIFNESKKGQNA
ncbi:MAG: DUF4231 domain-containing protein [Bacteroidota bacterium]